MQSMHDRLWELIDFSYLKLTESFVSSSLKALDGRSFVGPALQDCPSFEEQDCPATATRWNLPLTRLIEAVFKCIVIVIVYQKLCIK